MRTDNQPHAYYCGIDLNARSLSVRARDRDTFDRAIPVQPGASTCGVSK
jgi:hypothetical protein